MTQIALITGGSRGIGRSTAFHLARRGVHSIITYRERRDDAASAVAEIRALGGKAVALQLDAGDVSRFPQFADELRLVLQREWTQAQFDFLVNNAGMAGSAPFDAVTEEGFDELVNVHFKGVFFLTQRLLPLLRDGGRIVNVSSGLARFAAPGRSVYGSVKGAVEVLSRYLAQELGPRGIAVNAVAPGAVATDFGGGLVRDNPTVNSAVAAMTALGRPGQPDDIGAMISSLLSEDNRWITGQRIEVSGGMHL